MISAGCDKLFSPANITYEITNKNVTVNQVDSLYLTLFPTLFEIDSIFVSDTVTNYITSLKYPDDTISNCGVQFVVNYLGKNVFPLNAEQLISMDSDWSSKSPDLSLVDFRGLGQKYIGFRKLNVENGKMKMQYGWIRIEVSALGDSLSIIDMATNGLGNKSILAGQTE